MCKVTVSLLRTEQCQQITTKVNWHEKHFEIAIVNEANSFSGVMTENMVVEISEQLGITVDDYIVTCKSAFSSNSGSDNFIFKMIDDHVFQWRKVEDQIKILFGSVQLSAVPVIDTLHDIINVTVTNNNHLKENMVQLQKDNQLLESDNKELLQRIDEYMNIKMMLESELYNQFLVVLNTKKQRIKKLETLLKSNNIEESTISNESEENEDENKRQALYDCETESDSDNGTEDEKDKQTAGSSGMSLRKPIQKRSTMFDSDSEEITFIPKRKGQKPSQHDPGEVIHTEKNEEKAECSGSTNSNKILERSNVFDSSSEEISFIPKRKTKKPAQSSKETNEQIQINDSAKPNCSKSILNKRNNSDDFSDEQPPNKLKVFNTSDKNSSDLNKTTNSGKKKFESMENEISEDKDNSKQNINKHINNVFRDSDKKKLLEPNSNLNTNTRTTTSSVDDILAGLIA